MASAEVERNIYNIIGQFATGCPDPENLIPLRFDDAGHALPMEYRRRTLPNGKAALIMDGGVNAGDADDLERYLDQNRDVSEVWLHSPGGNASEGQKIGRVIRKHRLTTRVPPNSQCISACSMAFLGGVVRIVEENSAYGVHTFYNSGLFDVLKDMYGDNFLLNFPDEAQRMYSDDRDPNHADIVSFIEDERERKIRNFLHREVEQYDTLLASDEAVYASEMGVIPTCIVHDPRAHLRRPMVMMRHG